MTRRRKQKHRKSTEHVKKQNKNRSYNQHKDKHERKCKKNTSKEEGGEDKHGKEVQEEYKQRREGEKRKAEDYCCKVNKEQITITMNWKKVSSFNSLLPSKTNLATNQSKNIKYIKPQASTKTETHSSWPGNLTTNLFLG